MLLFEDLALVPMLFVLGLHRRPARKPAVFGTCGLIGGVGGRGDARPRPLRCLPHLFAQAARTKSPELFLAVSLLVVILASLATRRSDCRRSSAR